MVFDAVVRAGRPLRLRDISAATGLSNSKARMYLVSLIRSGLVDQLPDTLLYVPGLKALQLGSLAFNRDARIRGARSVVDRLARELEMPALLHQWDGNRLVIIANPAVRQHELPQYFRIGAYTPLANTATGKAFLAFTPSRQVAQDLAAAGEMEALPALADEFPRIRMMGFASVETIHFGDGIALSGYGAIAAPIVGVDGLPEFVLTLFLRSNIAAADAQAATRRLVDVARDASLAASVDPSE